MISDKDVNYIADLSRIHLKESEAGHLAKDLEKILDYIHKLNKLDTTNIEPTSHVLPLKNVYRQDKVRPSLEQKKALKFSVEQQNGSFKVPKVI